MATREVLTTLGRGEIPDPEVGEEASAMLATGEADRKADPEALDNMLD